MRSLILVASLFSCVVFGEDTFDATPYNPLPTGSFVFHENFQGASFLKKDGGQWQLSKLAKYGTQKWLKQILNPQSISGDEALVVGEKAKHYGLFAKFDKPALNTDKDLVLQYEVALTKGLECGGAYLKFLDAEAIKEEPVNFSNETPYIIMFGPDKCGATNKVHLIIRHKNPISGVWEEKHLKHAPSVPIDELSHLYSLTIRNDNTFAVKIDQEVKREGSLMDEFDPSFSPPKEIDDPEDHKPSDWVDEKMIPDETASKPADWNESAPFEILDMDAKKPANWLDDEEEYIKDPSAAMPEDWDEEEDGEWDAPMIKNPKCDTGCGVWERPTKKNPEYKGKWTRPMIENPEYKGEWTPKKITNPYYFLDETPCNLPAIGGVAIEIWTMTEGIAFDNLFVGYDAKVAGDYADATWKVKHELEAKAAEKKKAEQEKLRRESLKDEGTLTAKAEYYFYVLVDFMKENPLYLLPPVVLLIAIIFWLTKKSTSTAAAEEEEEVVEEEEEKEEKDDEKEDEKVSSDKSSPEKGKESPLKEAPSELRNRKPKKAE